MSYKVVTVRAGLALLYDTSREDDERYVASLERVDIWPGEDPFWIAEDPYVSGYGLVHDRYSHCLAEGRTRRECAAAAAEELGIAPNPARPPEPNYRITEWWD